MKKIINVRIGENLLKELDRIAMYMDTSRSEIIRNALIEYVIRYKKKGRI